MATLDAYQNALRNAGGSTSSPLFQQWAQRYNAGSLAAPSATGGAGGIQPIYSTGAQQGGTPTGYTSAYGGIPNLPLYTTDTTQQIGTDIGSQIRAQAPLFDPTMGAQWQAAYEGSRGMVPTDVATNLAQEMAERGQGIGFAPGAANTNAALAKALGLTSYQIQQQALADAKNLESMVPIQQTQLGTQTTDLGAQRAVYAAAPVPSAAAAAGMAAVQSGYGRGMGSVGMPQAPTPAASGKPWWDSSAQQEQSYWNSYLSPSNAAATAAADAEAARSRAWYASLPNYTATPAAQTMGTGSGLEMFDDRWGWNWGENQAILPSWADPTSTYTYPQAQAAAQYAGDEQALYDAVMSGDTSYFNE